jgi:hypothetical protein
VRTLGNLENNNYYHVLEFIQSLTCAIYAFLLQHVTAPAPGILLSHPAAYQRQLVSAGGRVLFEFLRYVGAPTLRCRWLRAGRAGDGGEVAELHTLALHLYRSVCHKDKSSLISLYTLMGLKCAHPKLRELATKVSLQKLVGISVRSVHYSCTGVTVVYIFLKSSCRNTQTQHTDNGPR